MDDINRLLSLQLENLSKLDSLLDQEKELLKHRDIESLIKFVMLKKDNLDSIQQADKALQEHPDNQKLKSDELMAEVEQLKMLLGKCQKKSAVNEEIVKQSLHSLDRLGKVLTEVRSTNLTYDATAKKVSLAGSTLRNLKA